MTRHIFTLSLGFGLLVLCAAQAFAQNRAPNCAPRDNVLQLLGDRYGESRQSIGMDAQSRVIEMFASSETRTWTITVTHPTGLNCLVASGGSYEQVSDSGLKPQGSAL